MSAHPPTWRPASLAPAGGPGAGSLAVVAICAFLLGVGAMAVAAWVPTAEFVAARVAGSATVAVWGVGLESPDAAGARAADVLARAPGIAAARLLEPAPVDRAVAEAIAPSPPGAAPDPRLVRLDFAPGAHPAKSRLARALSAETLPAFVDDHQPGASGLWRVSAIAAASGLGAVVALLALAAFAMGAGARRILRRSHDLIETLMFLGASDRFVRGVFSPRVFTTMAAASLLGVTLAAGAGALAPLLGERLPLPLPGAAPWSMLFAALAVAPALLALALTAPAAAYVTMPKRSP